MTSTATSRPDEARIHGVQLREVETTADHKLLRGRAVPYGESTDIGWFLESFAAGSLGKSARESAAALPLLVFHDDMKLPIGAIDQWDEQPTGLYGTWRISDDLEAQRAAKSAADGFLNFMSVRFMPIRSTWTFVDEPGGKDEVVREEARLLEVSLVSTPAYNGATIQWVRSSERRDIGGTPSLDAWKAELEKLRG